MLQLKIWLNPYTEEIKIKGKKYRIRDEYRRKIMFLNNMRIMFTIGLLILVYWLGLYESNVGFVFLGVILGVQIIFGAIFYVFLPRDIEKLS